MPNHDRDQSQIPAHCRKRILVIGGNGFIGSYLVQQLRNSGHEVAVLHRTADDAAGGVLQIRGDRNLLSDCRMQIRQFSPDVVVDLILSSGEQARQLMDESRQFTPRVVAISSMDVYRAWGVVHGSEPGPLEPLPLTEDSSLRIVRQLYPAETVKMLQNTFTWLDDRYDKIAVEEAIMSSSVVSGTVIRLPMVYGPGDRLHRFFPLLKRFADGRPAIVLPEDLAVWRGPRGYVENVAHAIALAATSDQAAGGVYNICQEPTLSELAWQKVIAKQVRWNGRLVVLPREQTPKHLLQPGNAEQHVVASSERIRAELRYKELVGIDEAINRTVAWEQKNPPSIINPQQFDYDAEEAALASER
jgi:nucleoside-diphosphate-sugar epimerase